MSRKDGIGCLFRLDDTCGAMSGSLVRLVALVDGHATCHYVRDDAETARLWSAFDLALGGVARLKTRKPENTNPVVLGDALRALADACDRIADPDTCMVAFGNLRPATEEPS